MPDPLFNRDLDININGVRIATRLLDETRQRFGLPAEAKSEILKTTFQVTKHLKGEPNTAQVSIHNLSKESRVRFQTKNARCIIKAGYAGKISTIFDGALEFGENLQAGTEWITSFQAGDGGNQYKSARINKHLAGKVNIGDALKTAVGALGIEAGNLFKAVSGNKESFNNGVTLTGRAEQSVKKLAKKLGLDFSVQDGKALFLAINDVVDSQIIELAPGTGLVGAPEEGEKGAIKLRSLLQPELLPGKRIKVTTNKIDGVYRIERSDFLGDTWGTDWYTDCECKPI